jgi:hypothetical protein
MKEVTMSRKALSLVMLGLFLLTVSIAGALPATAGDARHASDTVNAPKLWVTPLSLDFGPVGVGSPLPRRW